MNSDSLLSLSATSRHTMATSSAANASASRHNSFQKPANPLSYPQSALPFSKVLFKNPTSEYRGCPFWAWNNKLKTDQLLRQIDYFADMGMGGFHMHVRTGLDTEYMSPEFMDIVRSCVEYAESKKLLACLYDEDRWPSGAAGGKVIKDNPEHKQRHLLFTPHLYGTVELDSDCTLSSARARRSENGILLGAYDITLDKNGCLKSSRLLKKGESGNNMWYAYLETNPADPWYNGQTYVDTLSQEAMSAFIEITHEVYKSKVGDKFGSVVPCIFTDEPEFALMNQLSNPYAYDDLILPWTSDLAETFRREYSVDLIEDIPQLVWNLPEGKPSLARYRYHDHVCERFVSAFMDQIGGWCTANNIILTGHLMEEPTLHSQTTALGEAMRCYRSLGMPGMDLLVDRVEYNTAKQASSVARQNGIRGTLSEIYGVTHWYFTFEGHKGSGDWQAALGITFRVHHLTWVSMRGESKRDYPACIGYQSPWYKEYGYIEDYFARVGVAMTRGKALTRVGVIHPIESYWLCFGPNQSGDEMGFRDRAFEDLTNWLLRGLIDFDFISESLLPGQLNSKGPKRKLLVGHCEYDVIILPNIRTLRSSTLKILRDFSKRGGKVIIAGSAPELVDAKIPPSNPIIELSESIFWSNQSILCSLEEYRDLRVLNNDLRPTNQHLYQIRQDGEERFVFICNTDRSSPVETTIQLKGSWNVVKMDTFSGEETHIESSDSDGWVTFQYKFEGCASLLLHLTPLSGSTAQSLSLGRVLKEKIKSTSEVILDSVELSEPNVLMLDYAEYKMDAEDWQPRTEVLKIDNIIRSRLQLPRKGGTWKQPWTVSPSERLPKANVTLRFKFESKFTITEATQLAIEDPETFEIQLNGQAIPSSSHESLGTWWVDEDIATVPIPGKYIKKGTNILTLSFPFHVLTNIERSYLLGSFSVSLDSQQTTLKPLKLKELTWGDITAQGLPFYAGNIIYNCSLSVSPSANPSLVTLSVPNFSSPVLAVTNPKTEEKIGVIALRPYTLELGEFAEGTHSLTITAYGNRYNSFGHIHLPDWVGTGVCYPDIWRTEGDWWTDDYRVKPVGVLQRPTILVETNGAIEQENVEADWVLVSTEKNDD